MAMYDWNGNGKKDMGDNFIEYNIYKDVTNSSGSSKKTHHSSGSGISNFGAAVATIAGLFLAAFIVALFGGGEDTPVIITIILWIVCGVGIAVWFDEMNI